MDLEYCHYELTPLVKRNRFNDSSRKGLFIRVDTDYFLDYFPWKEFGDKSVPEFLDELKRKRSLPDFLLRDLDVEKNQHKIQKKGFLNHSFNNLNSNVCKVKFLGDFDELRIKVEQFQGLKIRIDFNNYGKVEEILHFWRSLSDKSKIEYFEDPGYREEDWQEFINEGIPIAKDRMDDKNNLAGFNILKPNRDKPKSKNCIFSNYMGSDLGMYHCYLHLMQKGDLDLTHGIVTNGIYKEQREIFSFLAGRWILNQSEIDKLYDDLRRREWKKIF